MKKVYLDGRVTGWRLHSLYNDLIKYPPKGYIFITNNRSESLGEEYLHSIDGKIESPFLRNIYDNFKGLAYLSYQKIKDNISRYKDFDLLYASQHVIFQKRPWVVDLEFANALIAYGKFTYCKRSIEKVLSSKYCKKILPWTKAGEKTLSLCLDCKRFKDKIETVYWAVHPKKFVKNYNKDVIRLLFVGTSNPSNIFDSFAIKGGNIVLNIFDILNEKYDNLELILRSVVPVEIKKKYGKLKNVTIIDNVIPWQALNELFKSADIFLFPAYNTASTVLLHAMSYEIPVITSDVFGASEIIENDKNGFLIKTYKKSPYYDAFIPNRFNYEFKRAMRIIDEKMLKDFVEKTSLLIENESLRRKMGILARKEIEEGKFSIKRRNEKLLRIFDEAIN